MLLTMSGAVALVAVEPKEVGDTLTWVTTEDYPFEALRAGMEGMTAVQLRISAEGRPSGCAVTVSSGHKLLDDTTCNLLLLRGRFEPARDQMGQPVSSVYSRRVRWQLPKDDEGERIKLGAPQPYSFIYEYDVSEAGLIENCKVAWGSGAAPGADPCGGSERVRMEPFRDAAGKPVRKHVTFRNSLTVEDAVETGGGAASAEAERGSPAPR
ncbi:MULTISPECIES: energy transducer TonB [Sphingomonadales]|uniref:energy transducer TonB n=1 Tax=Sphingomonadales TaxID=204457 RepID=UPI0002C0F41E|nr:MULTISPECIES: energy transducer TonB [Sphingomonas]AGH50967.1 TonB-like protein [Sphingomonas sp. MM-1]